MPPTFVRCSPIDLEWAKALVGLRLNVPNSWWPGFVDGGLNRGRIAAVNLGTPNEFYFEVELDNELGAHYASAMIPSFSTRTRGSRASRAFDSRCCVRAIRTTKWCG